MISIVLLILHWNWQQTRLDFDRTGNRRHRFSHRYRFSYNRGSPRVPRRSARRGTPG